METRATPQIDQTAATPAAMSKDRLPALDVLRGLAILGTLATNIAFFVLPSQDSVIGESVDAVVSFVVSLVTNGYWIGLLTIMFGIGMTIQYESTRARGESWLGTYPWRAVLLIVEGFLNYLFIVPFDVLMGYGLTALVVCVVLTRSRRVQTIVMSVAVVAHLAYLAYLSRTEPWGRSFDDVEASMMADRGKIPVGGRGDVTASAAADRWEDVMGVDGELGYWEGVQYNLDAFWAEGRAEIRIMFIMGIAVFLIGARLWQAGIFRVEGARLRRRVMWVGFGIGLPVDWGLRSAQTLPFAPEWWFTPPEWAYLYVRYVTATVVALGVLALVAHFYAGRDGTGRIGTLLTAVGKTALSCYLLQNILGLVLFGDHGLNLDARMPFSLGTLDYVLAFALISAILIVFSTLWLKRFPRGPMETVSHTAHAWLVRNTTDRVLSRRRRAAVAATAGDAP